MNEFFYTFKGNSFEYDRCCSGQNFCRYVQWKKKIYFKFKMILRKVQLFTLFVETACVTRQGQNL